ncbi:hypothetical protein MCELHM10_00498 [Paracoccaceae bacterium]
MTTRLLGPLILVLTSNVALAQTRTDPNMFQFFEYALTPIAIKWACGGERDQDMAALDAMISANPEDAEEAEVANAIELLVEVSKREDGFTKIIGFETTDQQKEQLCSAALPLSFGAPGMTDQDVASEQAKWDAFFGVIEEWQTEASP